MSTQQYISSVVRVGSLALGGTNPIRLQSMTNTDTMDTRASVEQCIRIIESGADLVRLTAQGVREAENLAHIKKELEKAGFNTPLVADIHFNPAAAETAARIVEKVRINPGNYSDKRATFINVELTDKEYNEEIERIHQRLLPLINICREHNTVIRVGINHGSLSDRIMTRYGNTPLGMVQSAMEFIGIFRQENFNNLVLSMKSSDTSVMVNSTRMLVQAMQESGMSYPLHLGVTEAGEGEDGRIRSAAGIGALLQEGIGDTIRVSLSEDPEKEIPVARTLASIFSREVSAARPSGPLNFTPPVKKPDILKNVNGPIVITDLRLRRETGTASWLSAGFRPEGNRIYRTDRSADIILLNNLPESIPEATLLAVPYDTWKDVRYLPNVFPFFRPEAFFSCADISDDLNIVITGSGFNPDYFSKADPSNTLVVFSFDPVRQPYEPLRIMEALGKTGMTQNIILNPNIPDKNISDAGIRAAALLGSYIIDNKIAGILLNGPCGQDPAGLTLTAFSILQCTGKRITGTIYLSCPTCGRTKFNLQETVKKVKAATGHLKGLKIAVMGCIVNGPGEMAGADYGYVGAAPGKVHIYKGTEAVLKNVPEENAIDELLRIIEESHRA
ncbi:MAG TPA: (E)-4-hydroxy-3-methylbut-2-enyl-diphosphate synthase [Bacteroidales bacterium]|nr:(E)-4-hydroxy-3-methylbut-2-enyl-diphosphate synthase [Bacteroidales bacterium]